MLPMIPNHNGYGLRNDERPFAHKIPPGGNWRNLTHEEKLVYWNGKIPTEGGSTNGLRKRAWTDAAGTITTTPLQKLSCQLHPGKLDVEEETTIRNYNVTPQLPPNGLTVAELFCGGGLMAVGLKAAGYDITFANDFDKRAVEAYAYNLGDYVVCGDITSDEIQAQIPDADIFAGGPPCQSWSIAGKGKGDEDDRGKLVWTYLDIIERKQPKAFVFENVKGLTQKKHRHTLDALLVKFAEIGYNVSWRVINSWDYGVAQKRERVFIVGVRKDIGFTFDFPSPWVWDYQTQTLRDVIGDLPEPIANHDPKPLTSHVRERLENGGYETYLRKHPAGNPELPSRTLTAHLAKGSPDGMYFSPEQPRRFTVRECLRIQSVPDSYVLPESLSLSAQYRIVGNGVASRVAYLLGIALAEQLNAALAQSLPEAA
ncbi:DNA cytosine methyltransferase [Paenibacillus tundrae]|uniref:Cytosine-specific methyltransferase n=1 Tax=Paenibacillus tundrae TaxID=528187 RepID=A0ABT9W674_9BACL|nr:DNA cytosine methyltransferase [Paenibacillus tundrae]MDQ0168743.1 DNA (cytosine-5)-methyltransferase 1 [Paenibacillus tundrae]